MINPSPFFANTPVKALIFTWWLTITTGLSLGTLSMALRNSTVCAAWLSGSLKKESSAERVSTAPRPISWAVSWARHQLLL
ncbi:hypothetical protein D3C80_2022480 [compost metagenome]